MSKSKTMMILEAVVSGAADTVSIIAAVMLSPYGSSMNERMRRIDEAFEDTIPSFPEKEKRNMQQLIYKLKKEGLIDGVQGKIKITGKGRKKMDDAKDHSLPGKRYKELSDDGLKIIAFDVPEKERRKRRWMREALFNMGFEMLQKSVWYGKKKIPEEFIRDLADVGLLEYIDIMAVTKTGSIRKYK